MWGTHIKATFSEFIKRFIPTHVGNTTAEDVIPPQALVHPHACGEHDEKKCEVGLKAGSSPRMWGTLLFLWIEITLGRFIPTHVGNTGFICLTLFFSTVHPHACGEH